MKTKIKVKVFRYNPAKDSEPYFREYIVEVDDMSTVLDVLTGIQEQDPTFMFMYSCRRGVCGSCAVIVNGIPVLACQTRILEIPSINGEYKIEPLYIFPVKRDLVVDTSKILRFRLVERNRLYRVKPYIPPERIDVELSKKLEILKECTYCTLCLNACPIYALERTRFSGPITMRILATYSQDPRDGLDRISLAYMKGLYLCLTCGLCKAVCPYEIPIDTEVLNLRMRSYSRNLVPEKLVDVRESILDPELGNPLFKSRDERGYWVKDLKPSNKGRVLVFAGCMASYVDVDSVKALCKILEICGIEYQVLGSNEYCCGMPLYLMGDRSSASELAKKNLELFLKLGIERIVTPCPSCYRMFKYIYPDLGIDISSKGIEIMHSVHILLELMNKGCIETIPRVDIVATYHDPCDLGRHSGIFDEPRTIINRVVKKFIEMNNNRYKQYSVCCGAGGNLRITDPKLSLRIAVKRLEDIPQNIDVVLHACPTCKIQFIEACNSINKQIANVSLQELLLKTLVKESKLN